ncbi:MULTISPECIES: hypothetical protein [Halorussus]|uniref:hypothetical protein n=1 Tax=Halorussus TaxID=1070314 RepID=UPI000E2197A9|nr:MULTISPECIES: hypothetical protein [Halorussus]NHN58231.1 hypothetical protein [Halorussus sp. JP-T4]
MERQGTPTGPGEPDFGEQAETAKQPDDIAEMDITEPTVTWLEVSHPQQPIPIGEKDRVLDSHFNEQYDVWEVLLVALPDEEDEDGEE